MRRMPAAVRYLTLHRLAFSITALTVLLTAVAAAATSAFAASAAAVANRETLTDNLGSSILVTVSTDQAASTDGQIARTLVSGAPGLPLSIISAQQSSPLNFTGGLGGQKAQTLLLDLPQARRHVVLTSGSWPGTSPSGAVAACLPASVAGRLGLRAGDTLTVRDSIGNTAAKVQITCTFRELKPAGAYWLTNQVGSSGVSSEGGFTIFGPMLTGAPGASWPVPAATAVVLAIPDFSAMTAGNLNSLGNSVSDSVAALANSQALAASVTTSLPQLLSEQAIALEVARSLLLIGQLILLVMAGATLAVAVHLLASQRAGQPALLMARGASRRQLAVVGATDAALLAIPAAIAGPLLGGWLAPLVAKLGLAGTASIQVPHTVPLVAWLAGIAVAAGCAVVIALPWLRTPPSPITERSARARQKTVIAVLANGADLALILLAVGASWQLAHYAAPVSTGLSGAIGVDPILVAAPVLALAAGTLVMLRLLPRAIRLGERVAARGRGIALPAAAWLISRRALRQAGPALLTVLAVATAVIVLGESASWQRSVQDQANFTAGADARVTMPPAASLPIGETADITAAPGVRAATPVIRLPFDLPSNSQATLLAIDGAQAEQIVPLRSDLAIRPARDPFAPISSEPAVVGSRLPGHPATVQVVASLSAGSGGHAVTGATLYLQLRDAAGIGYTVSAGTLAPDGAAQRLDVPISADGRADYPLWITGFSLGFFSPLTDPDQTGTLTLHSVSVSSGGGPASQVLADLPMAKLTAQLSGEQEGAFGTQAYGQPKLLSFGRTSQGLVARFVIGAGDYDSDSPPEGAYATFTVTPQDPAALPAIATTAFLQASGAHLGEVIEVGGLQNPLPVRLVGEVAQFPTITTPAGGVLVNQAELQLVAEASGNGPIPVTEWWLRDTGNPKIAQLPGGTSVTTLAAVLRSLSSQPLGVAPLDALAAVAAVALLLAGSGFLVSVTSSAERGRDLAVLDALGATPGQLTRMRCLEQAMLSVPAAIGGLALGLLLSRLIIPAVTITAQASHPIPSVLIQIPLLPAVLIALAVATVPVVAVAVTMLRGTATMARLRVEEDR
jgi:hypothetical protein